MANGKNPWRLKAEIKREVEEKREDSNKRGKSMESASNSLVTHRMSIDQEKCLLVSATSEQRVSLVDSVNINRPKCAMWECSHNRWQEVCFLLLGDAVASNIS